MNTPSVIERILSLEGNDSDGYTESDLRDPHVQLFMLLANNPDRSFTIEQVIKEINDIGLVKLKNKVQARGLFNILYANDLAVHDFSTQTYRYNDTLNSYVLKNNINMIQAL